ncbi:MAG: SDR family oxidoreductase [Pseudomonas sp.]|uniref:SDR family oxidoreductase n=1 Tax=Pseudomonas sp. TaxID=306 RepID=UPI003982AA11
MNKRVFITGGASGLGQALALCYARDGWDVCIADLNDVRGELTCDLLKVHGGKALYFHADVTLEADLQRIADELQKQWNGIDLLINNAGVAQLGAIDEVALSDWEWILNINLLGVVRGCKVFTPLFKKQGHGQILNIASMAGLLDVPLMAAYNVSKAAVVALSTTLEQELMPHGIRVSVACPSFFQTNLEESVRTDDPGMKKLMGKLLARGELSADDVAERIVDGATSGQTYIFPHIKGERMWLAKRYLPQPWFKRIFQHSVKRMLPKPAALNQD